MRQTTPSARGRRCIGRAGYVTILLTQLSVGVFAWAHDPASDPAGALSPLAWEEKAAPGKRAARWCKITEPLKPAHHVLFH
jgi:hypothetical protein